MKLYGDYLFDTHQYAFPSIFEQRVRGSKDCYTDNPNEADLFYVPVLPLPKYSGSWERACKKLTGQMIWNEMQETLNTINKSNTACQHFFAVGRSHFNVQNCEGWFAKPDPYFQNFQRLAYSHVDWIWDQGERQSRHWRPNQKGNQIYAPEDVGDNISTHPNSTQNRFQNLESVPRPSVLHFAHNKQPWQDPDNRVILMSYLGTDTHGDIELRRKVVEACKAYDDNTCYHAEWNDTVAIFGKGKAKFCLEPHGDDPWRRGLFDSILYGCIPVLFSELAADIAPWFWKDWKARSHIIVPRSEFLEGMIDLKALLEAMPSNLLVMMQSTIQKKARQFQYSIDDDPDDAIGILLRNLYKRAQKMTEQRKCMFHDEGHGKDQAAKEDTTFDYTAFWQKVKDEAHKSLEKEITNPAAIQSKCPKVYVYNLSTINALDDDTMFDKLEFSPFGDKIIVDESKFGKDDKELYEGYLYGTHQYAFPSILEQRIRASEACYTNDPNHAELFYAPVLPKPKRNNMWDTACSQVTGQMVQKAIEPIVASILTNRSVACRHFVSVGKAHWGAGACEGWFSRPEKFFQNIQRLAYSHVDWVWDEGKEKGLHLARSQQIAGKQVYAPDDAYGSVLSTNPNATKNKYPNLVSVPYPTGLHFQRVDGSHNHQPWQDPNKRTILMSFLGKGRHGDLPVRQKIVEMCKSYDNNSVCYRNKWSDTEGIAGKGRAKFCLEPPGDDPWRKSLSDSIVFGCIPVLFSELSDDFAPWFWKDWKARARILIPREEFVQGKIDLKTLLESTPEDVLAMMQSTLKEKARQFQYSLDDDPDDAIGILLKNLHQKASMMEQNGKCGFNEG
jgi:hypothetical protein